VHFGVTGIDHQPLIVGLLNEYFEQGFPLSLIAPAAKAPVGIFPIAIVRRQITPGSACTQYPEDGVDEVTIVTSDTTPRAFLSGQMRGKLGPSVIVNVVAAMCWPLFEWVG
jgi:hypothetical protein